MRSVNGKRPNGGNRDEETLVPVHASPSESQLNPAELKSQLTTAEQDVEEWRDRALRLQAEMENYRKRQRRLAEERVAEERERLLRRFLEVADELERALTEPRADANSLHQGIELTYRSLMQFLKQEGVEPVPAQGQPFDPGWHEAAGAMPRREHGVQPNTVVEVLRPGYRLEGRLLRPARVIVSA